MRFFATLLFSILVLVSSNSPAADSYENGIQAYYAGNYKKALEILEPLAKQGDAGAHYSLATMYDEGLGVEQDDKQALRYYKKAAEQGSAASQINLVYMYIWGNGVEQSAFEARKWNSLASVHFNSERTFGNKVAEWFTKIYLDFKLSSDQKKEADEWVKTGNQNTMSENGHLHPRHLPDML